MLQNNYLTIYEHGLIPLSWILKAQERAEQARVISSEELKIGVDVARSGADCTVFLFRKGSVVKNIEVHRNLNTMEVVGKLIFFVERHRVPWEDVIGDEIGIAAGVVDRLREQGRHVKAVNFGSLPGRFFWCAA